MKYQRYAVTLLFAALFLGSGSTMASTWYLEADGSGDFSTIQEAVDAASPGDTIELGPGVYDDFETAPASPYWVTYVQVTKDNLTIRGSGIDATIIGKVEDGEHLRPVNVISVHDDHSLTLEDLTVQVKDWVAADLLRAGQSQLQIRRCGFRDAVIGIGYFNSAGTIIEDCEFSDLSGAAIMATSEGPGRVSDCRFERVKEGVLASGPAMLTVSNCYFDGSESGGNSFGAGVNGRAEFLDCTFVNHTRAGLILAGPEAHLQNCTITETTGHGLEMLGQGLRGSGNTISSESCVLVITWASFPHFQGNEFLAGGNGLLARVYPSDVDPEVLNFTNNYWGTDDPQSIADLIQDHLDDPALPYTIDFEPFVGGPVSVESRTWSEVKESFRKIRNQREE
jgi:hypothetical protein